MIPRLQSGFVNTALIKYEEMAGERLTKEESIRYMREVHVWIVLMFSASKEIKQDNVGVEFSDQTTPCLSCNPAPRGTI